MTDLTGRRRTDNPDNAEHVTVDWVLRIIAEMLKKCSDDKDCDNNCPAMRGIQQKIKDMEKSEDKLWEKMDWIYKIAITTLIGMLGTAIGIILILMKLK
jgi:hypothetical protein